MEHGNGLGRCPVCEAPAGQDCRTIQGAINPPHAERTAEDRPAVVGVNEDQRGMVVALLNMLVQALAPWRSHMEQQGAAPDSDLVLATAAATYCGTILGELAGMGMISEAQLDQHLDAVRSNAATGFDAGKAKVLQLAQQQLAELDKGQVQ